MMDRKYCDQCETEILKENYVEIEFVEIKKGIRERSVVYEVCLVCANRGYKLELEGLE